MSFRSDFHCHCRSLQSPHHPFKLWIDFTAIQNWSLNILKLRACVAHTSGERFYTLAPLGTFLLQKKWRYDFGIWLVKSSYRFETFRIPHTDPKLLKVYPERERTGTMFSHSPWLATGRQAMVPHTDSKLVKVPACCFWKHFYMHLRNPLQKQYEA